MIEIPVIFASVMSLLARSEVELDLNGETGTHADGATYTKAALKLHHKPTGAQWSHEAIDVTLERACRVVWRQTLEMVNADDPDLAKLLRNTMWLAMSEHWWGG